MNKLTQLYLRTYLISLRTLRGTTSGKRTQTVIRTRGKLGFIRRWKDTFIHAAGPPATILSVRGWYFDEEREYREKET